jgi:soluble lytic murein transglycosylase
VRPSPARVGVYLLLLASALLVAGVVGYTIWRLPSRWKNDTVAPPGFEAALSEFDNYGFQAGLDRLSFMRRDWTHPAWNDRSDFLTGYWSLRLKRYESAARALERLASPRSGLPLADRAAVIRGSALLRMNRPTEALKCVEPFARGLDRYWAGPSALGVMARAEAAIGRSEEAIARIDEALKTLPDRSGARLALVAARLAREAGDSSRAVARLKELYACYPESSEAEVAIELLHEIGTPAAEWTSADLPLFQQRSAILLEAGQTDSAVKTWEFARERVPDGAKDPVLSARYGAALVANRQHSLARKVLATVPEGDQHGTEVLLARARIAVSKGQRRRAAGILRPLLSDAAGAENRAAAELLLAEAADDAGSRSAALRHYGSALSRLDPLPSNDQAAWRAGWLAFKERRYSQAEELFRRLDRPDSHPGHQAAGLYWRARIEESSRRPAQARRLLQQTLSRFRNDYYGIRASVRLGLSSPPTARPAVDSSPSPDPGGSGPLSDGWTVEPSLPDPYSYPPPAREAISAGRELEVIHLPREAFAAYAFARRSHPDDRALCVRLAELALDRGERLTAIPYLETAYPELLSDPSPSIPARHREALFPLERWDEIRSAGRSHSLDPFLVSAVILQESAFNPLAVSRAGALGLMQLMPATGRALARRLKAGRINKERLFEPDLNITLGTAYLADLVRKYDGKIEPALAAYNAGTTRADRWWPRARGDVERFVEDIPFTETRLYIKRVLSARRMYSLLHRSRETPEGQ